MTIRPCHSTRLLVVLPIVGASLLAAPAQTGGRGTALSPGQEYSAQMKAWREKHEQDYRRDFVTIAGLHFLETGTHTVGSGAGNGIVLSAHVPPSIGRVTVGGGRVVFEPEAGVSVLHDGRHVSAPVVLKEPGKPPSGDLTVGDVRIVVHESGDRLSLRVRDPQGDLARGFKGFRWFPVDAAYRVTARLIRDPVPRTLQVINTFNDVVAYQSEGVVEFELHGRTLRLRPFTTRPKRFYFVFRDASSGGETYATGRFLYTNLLDDGTTILDFNEAYNPPCAFNPYTTCPIPLKENILPVKILAGERAYAGEVKLPRPKQ